jgi:excisionase family DNA binding protein
LERTISNVGCPAAREESEVRGNARMTSGFPNEKELLDTQEVAEYLGIEHTTVQRWCRSGYLRGLKIGKGWRIHREALENLLKQSENSAKVD